MSIILNIRNNIPQRKLCVNDRRYAWPDPLTSEEQAVKYAGRDIDALTGLEKWQELKRLEAVLPWVDEKAILIVDLSIYPARIITKLQWGFERMKLLKKGAA